jgi:hypothetical protein
MPLLSRRTTMPVSTYDELAKHHGHVIITALYGPREKPMTAAIECETCHEILLNFKRITGRHSGEQAKHKSKIKKVSRKS